MNPPAALGPATAASPALRRRLRRTGIIVIGGSIAASALFAHISFTVFGQVQYSHTMVFATLIPLVVASLAFRWITRLTLELEASRRALERLAHEDALTGLANRRAAMTQLAAWSAAPAPGSPVCVAPICLAIADIDFFKRVNDRLGHDGGDASLVHFAAMLRRMVPEGWLVARIGGEEFLLAARTPDFATFAARIESLRVTIAQTPLITPAGPWSLTASFGLAEQAPAEPPDRLISRADRALYAAKQGGRNRSERAA
jgi:diguanylate cyclase (GGDEF)-like protein